eukprot:930148_1
MDWRLQLDMIARRVWIVSRMAWCVYAARIWATFGNKLWVYILTHLISECTVCGCEGLYSLAHALAVRSKNNTNTTSISEALENLAVVSMYSNCVHDSIRYTQEIIAHLGAMKPPAPHIKILNARAYYACCLTLPASPQEKSTGYFGLHFVHCKDWQRAHKHIEYVMACVQKKRI